MMTNPGRQFQFFELESEARKKENGKRRKKRITVRVDNIRYSSIFATSQVQSVSFGRDNWHNVPNMYMEYRSFDI